MATCGYLCPSCEGRGFDEKGDVCDWCSTEPEEVKTSDEIKSSKEEELKEEELKEWTSKVHGRCCGDL